MRALITGITGQDGSYLAEFLLSKGYEVHGLIRRSSSPNTSRIAHILDRVKLHYGDMTDSESLLRACMDAEPEEIYNLAAQSHVQVSFETSSYTALATGLGALHLLQAAEVVDAKFYQASSSELFGQAEAPQSETTRFHPRSPYGIAKQFAYWTTVNYREAYKLHASNGILFNHESPRRGEEFVTQKIVKAAVNIATGKQKHLLLGNLDAKRDWGFAGEYVEAMWLMLQQEKPDDYVIATGETHSVREFVALAFKIVGLNWEKHVIEDAELYRPAEVDILQGDASKAEKILGWKPQVKFEGVVELMVAAELKKHGVGLASFTTSSAPLYVGAQVTTIC